MANLSIVISALNTASKDLQKVKTEIDGVDTSAKNAKGGAEGFDKSIGNLMATAGLVAAAVGGVGLAMKEVYETAKEGADLEYSQTKFENLAGAIGTTADALKNDLKDATDGLVSDADLVAGATDIMSLGLVDTKDDVVRLSSVATQLGMDMNQLVLTLTNETTMRFDTLGVSVDGFEEKVKKLEETGMSASDAFKEAFLQQAEEQIEKVGKKADTAAGDFARLEAASKDLSNSYKTALLPIVLPVVDALGDQIRLTVDLIDNMDELKTAVDNGAISQNDYSAAALAGKYSTEAGVYATNQLIESIDTAATVTDDFAARQKVLAASSKSLETIQSALTKEFNDQKGAITKLDKNFGGIISLAKNFDKALEEIVKQEDIMAKNPIGSDKYEEAEKKVKSLKEEMADLANQVVLDMFQATIAIGGITEAEADAYFDMAEDMGIISKGAAQAAIDAYGNAISKINGMKIDPKTGNVKINVDDSEYRGWKPNDFTAYIKLKRDSVEIDKWLDSVHYTTVRMRMTNERMATGGQVASNTIYTVGEEGPELFVPASNGYIINHEEASRALAGAVNKGNSAVDPSALASAIASALAGVLGSRGGNVYNLTMPTSNNPADIKTAFELMEAWAV